MVLIVKEEVVMRIDKPNEVNQDMVPKVPASVKRKTEELANKKPVSTDKPVEGSQKDKNSADEAEVIKAIEAANKSVKVYDRRLEYSIHEATHQIMIKVIDTSTPNETVIREIPSEKILDMVAKMWELAGLFVDEKA